MRKLLFLLFMVVFVSAPVFAQQAEHPWEADQRLINGVKAAVQTGGILAARPRVAELERALAGAPHAFEVAANGDGEKHYVLTDGATDIFAALGSVPAGGKGTTVAVNNPYLMIAFYLGSYYNEVGQHEDAARVLGAGLALPERFGLGESRPMLLVERGAALGQLKRWDEALASYDEALKAPDAPDAVRAYMLRGRGSVLIDLNRLEEAEAAFKDSLKLAPNSEVAQHELQYIANLRAGNSANSSVMTKVQPSQ